MDELIQFLKKNNSLLSDIGYNLQNENSEKALIMLGVTMEKSMSYLRECKEKVKQQDEEEVNRYGC